MSHEYKFPRGFQLGSVFINSVKTAINALSDTALATEKAVVDFVLGNRYCVDELVEQSSHGFVAGNVLRYSAPDAKYVKAKADVVETSEVIGVVSSVVDGDNFRLATRGKINLPNSLSLTADTVYFLSSATAGGLTATRPSGFDMVVKPVLIVARIGSTTTSCYILNYEGVTVNNTAFTVTAGTGFTTVDTFSMGLGYNCNWFYGLKSSDGTVSRAGRVYSSWNDNGDVEYMEESNKGLGDSTKLTFSASTLDGDVFLKVNNTGLVVDWSIKIKREVL